MNDFFSTLDADIIARFRTAIELGKWPDGRKLSEEQRDMCMQAVIYYEHKHLPEEERTGYVPPKETACAPKESQDEIQEIKWK